MSLWSFSKALTFSVRRILQVYYKLEAHKLYIVLFLNMDYEPLSKKLLKNMDYEAS